ncbi:MAG: Unknown protein [uncultured Sulfurovum sp.]|uniref:Uncharacterized protein n=1 Tax=uncultured Sulfurovum sp. TaxID=269237 RepID=A0A6S6SDX4_9BACT|nr:MAG: Unknown protein [uncultured Sulfurovum sp.]
MILNYILPIIFVVSYLESVVIQLPKEYDNIKNSLASTQSIVLYNSALSNTISSKTYRVAGENLRLRCEKIKKIQCTNASVKIQTQIGMIKLTDKSNTTPFQNNTSIPMIPVSKQVVIEDSSATEWAICGVVVGMYSEDSSILSKNQVSSGKVEYTLEYRPLYDRKKYVYFSNSIFTGGSNSNMNINIKQYCE